MAYEKVVNKNFNGEYRLEIKHTISNGYELQTPIVEGSIKWETDWQGSPGKLTFKVCKDKNGNLNFQEGDMVAVTFKDATDGWVTLFNGFIFTKKRSKSGWIEVTAYDQLRYLKNKWTCVYKKKTASEVIKDIAKDFSLDVGEIENTNYVIGSRTEDDQALFDVIQNALDLTLISGGKRYILYSHDNKLYLRDAERMRTNVIINEKTAEDFDYSSTIDEDVYNEVLLYYDNDETNSREKYYAASPNGVAKWGRLVYTESIQNTANARNRATQTLKMYNQKKRTIKVKGAFGDYRCRAGASVIVQLGEADIDLNNYMIIEKATHTLENGKYRMDLTLTGFRNEVDNNIVYDESGIVAVTKKAEINGKATEAKNVNVTLKMNRRTGSKMGTVITWYQTKFSSKSGSKFKVIHEPNQNDTLYSETFEVLANSIIEIQLLDVSKNDPIVKVEFDEINAGNRETGYHTFIKVGEKNMTFSVTW